MSTPESIIDVNPVASTSSAQAARVADGAPFCAPSYQSKTVEAAKNAASQVAEAARNVTEATIIGDAGAAEAGKPNVVGGVAQTVVGGVIMLVGVPMLILPGPGLLAIGGGAAIAAGGLRKAFGKKKTMA